jgi:polyketide synthase 12
MTGGLEPGRLERTGVGALAAEEGLGLFDRALELGEALLAPVRLDVGALGAQARAGLLPALLRGLVREPVRRAEAAGSLAERLAAVAPADRAGVAEELVRAQVAAVLGHASAGAVDPGLAFKDLGFDSLAAVELRNRLARTTGLRLPATLVFDHPTAAAVARYLVPLALPGVATNDHQPSEEDEIRHILASIPIGRLRRAGLLEALVELAKGDPVDAVPANGAVESIDEMDVEALIRLTREAAI